MRIPKAALALLTAVVAGLSVSAPAVQAATGVVIGGSTPATSASVFIDGRELQVGRSTREDIQRVERRRPDGVFTLSGRFGAGTVLAYEVRGGCWRQYTIPVNSSRLGDFETTCRAARTFNGVRPDMAVKAAASAARVDWTPAQYGSKVCPLAGSLLSLTSQAPFVAALSDPRSERVESIGIFATDPALSQVARCGSSPF